MELNRGTFNVIRVVDDSTVIRVSDTRGDDEGTREVERGVALVHLFNQFHRELGPARLREVRRFTKNPKTGMIEHYLERLQPTASYRTIREEERAFTAFSLLWFFVGAQGLFDFSHRDLKPENIMFRVYGEPRRFSFKIGQSRFEFIARFSPVVIDLDMGSVYVTKDRARIGTYYSAPPEALLWMIAGETERQFMPIPYESYDWWSLGVSLLEFFLGRRLWNAFINERVAYIRRRFPGYSEMSASYVAAVPLSALFVGLVHQQDAMCFQCPLPMLNRHFKELLESIIQNDKDYRSIKAAIERLIPPPMRALLCQLISWVPAQRMAGGTPALHLLSSYFDAYRTEQGVAEYELNLKPKLTEEALRKLKQFEDIRLLEGRLELVDD